VTRSIIFY